MSNRKSMRAINVDYSNLRSRPRWWCSCIPRCICEKPHVIVRRNVTVDFLTILFATSTWIGINGLFVQLPLLVQTQPEQWNLPSYIAVFIQAANIGPICYSLLHRFMPGKVKDSSIICILLVLGLVSVLLFALFYKESTFVLGQQRSLTLFVLVFCIALVGCTSSVLFMPYMSNFHEIYLISYFVGEGLSGFVPSLVALVQGVGGNPHCINETQTDGTVLLVPDVSLPHFSTSDFFFFLFSMMVCSTLAFLILNYVYAPKRESLVYKHNCPVVLKCYESEFIVSDGKNTHNPIIKTPNETFELCKDTDSGIDVGSIKNNILTEELMKGHRPTSCQPLFCPMNIILLFIVVWICLLGNGFLPSIQSYSCLPYGNLIYHLAATLGSMANPAACFLAFFMPISSIRSVFILTFLSSLTSCYITVTAFTSPVPPLLHMLIGDILIVLCWIVNTGLISYVKMSTAALFRQQGSRALFWCGAGQQVGSAVGALIAFSLMNWAQTFTSYNPCE